MASVTNKSNNAEKDLWQNAVKGDTSAFEDIVRQHQSAVCGVAFSIVGDFASSQDIAQETFWAAWKSKDSLRDASRLGSWLCGIARNIAKQWRRKKVRSKEVGSDQFGNQFDSAVADPADDFVSKEEESVVWNTLEEIPENYREVLVLYYRKGQSIEEVANSLGLSNDAARQRLSRGREILRNRVSHLIEGVLDRTNPTRTFTARVMAGIASMGVAGSSSTAKASSLSMALNSSTATTAASLAKVMAGGSALGLLGGLLGASGGLAGAWFGVWWPAQMAPTETERQLLVERGKGSMKICIVFTCMVMMFATALIFFPAYKIPFVVTLFSMMVVFTVSICVHGVKTQSLVRKLRSELSPKEDPNLSKIGQKARKKFGTGQRRFGRKYTSPMRVLGIPLVDIQVSDSPQTLGGKTTDHKKARPAHGWIAIGDVATGFIAIGGRSFGVISIGGASAGVVAIGGLSIGLLSIGGMAIGMLAFGGGAIGYDAAGGGALGWHSAAGGAAAAWHAAAGGAAFAHDFAVGGGARALEANTELAKQVIEKETYISLLKNSWLVWVVCVPFAIVPGFLVQLLYTREPQEVDVQKEKLP